MVDGSLHRSQIFRPARNASAVADAGGEFVRPSVSFDPQCDDFGFQLDYSSTSTIFGCGYAALGAMQASEVELAVVSTRPERE